tara:strand:- start:933 stop:1127 length:195 start_codon:yes stop_codon:yes gene_type:complete
MSQKVESYAARSRRAEVEQAEQKEALRLKKIELGRLKKEHIAEYVTEKNKETLGGKILNLFRKK